MDREAHCRLPVVSSTPPARPSRGPSQGILAPFLGATATAPYLQRLRGPEVRENADPTVGLFLRALRGRVVLAILREPGARATAAAGRRSRAWPSLDGRRGYRCPAGPGCDDRQPGRDRRRGRQRPLRGAPGVRVAGPSRPRFHIRRRRPGRPGAKRSRLPPGLHHRGEGRWQGHRGRQLGRSAPESGAAESRLLIDGRLFPSAAREGNDLAPAAGISHGTHAWTIDRSDHARDAAARDKDRRPRPPRPPKGAACPRAAWSAG